MLSQRNHRVRDGVLSSVAIWDVGWRLHVSRRCLMSQRIDGTHPPPFPHIFPMACLPKLHADDTPSPFLPACRPSSGKASDWNAASVRSFVTYDALMKFPDLHVTVSRSCPDERRSSSRRQIMEWLRHHPVRSARLLYEVTS